jgi:hypothetical protein
MRPRKQKSNTGCGIAVLATVADVSYEHALQAVFHHPERKKRHYIDWRAMRAGLSKLGVKYGKLTPARRSAADIAAMAKKAKLYYIGGAAEKANQKNWHYVIFTPRGKMIDPQFGKAIPPSEWCRIRSVLEVLPFSAAKPKVPCKLCNGTGSVADPHHGHSFRCPTCGGR